MSRILLCFPVRTLSFRFNLLPLSSLSIVTCCLDIVQVTDKEFYSSFFKRNLYASNNSATINFSVTVVS